MATNSSNNNDAKNAVKKTVTDTVKKAVSNATGTSASSSAAKTTASKTTSSSTAKKATASTAKKPTATSTASTAKKTTTSAASTTKKTTATSSTAAKTGTAKLGNNTTVTAKTTSTAKPTATVKTNVAGTDVTAKTTASGKPAATVKTNVAGADVTAKTTASGTPSVAVKKEIQGVPVAVKTTASGNKSVTVGGATVNLGGKKKKSTKKKASNAGGNGGGQMSQKSKRALVVIVAIVLILAIIAGVVWYFVFYKKDETPDTPAYGTYDLISTFDAAAFTGLEVYYIDVGQGDCILIIYPDGATMLIDAGSSKKSSRMTSASAASQTIAEIKSYGVTEITYLIATHADADHISMMVSVFDEFEVENIYYNKDDTQTSSTFTNFKNKAAAETYNGLASNVTVMIAAVDIVINDLDFASGNLDGITYTFTMYCPGEVGGNTIIGNDRNHYSPISILNYQGKNLMFTGDAEEKTETWFINKMNNAGITLNMDVLKVGHHGSRNGTTTAFLQFVHAEVAVICLAEGNSYGHPHVENIQRLTAESMTILRTDWYGTILITIDTSGNMKIYSEVAYTDAENAEEYV